MMKTLALPLVVAGLVIAPGCNRGGDASLYQACSDSVPSWSPNVVATAAIALSETDSSSLQEALRLRDRYAMRQAVEATRRSALISARCSQFLPQSSGDDRTMASSAGGSQNESTSKAASQTSTTNNQVAGVDEADFVKNDNKYIYVANGSKFRIVEAWPAATMREVGSIDVPGEAKKLFVANGRALVYSSVASTKSSYGYGYGGYYGDTSECTYGYQCELRGDGTSTVISIFDISAVGKPTLVRRIDLDSSLIAARRIGNTVHTVVSRVFSHAQWVPYMTESYDNKSEASVSAAFDARIAANDKIIDQAAYTAPQVSDSLGAASFSKLYRSDMADGGDFTTLVSLDLLDAKSTKLTTILSGAGAVYASAEALYMAVPHEQHGYGWFSDSNEKQLSSVHKFNLGKSPLDSSYVGSGRVKGRVLNQFAMDEWGGDLRIATTTGHVPDLNVHSTLAVLRQDGASLKAVGMVDRIAPTEDIRSVRFDENRAYMVTFKKTDPLYVFDLTMPTLPRILSELKIPGFSTYMHLMDETHLLTIGYDAADHDTFAYFTGVLLQIFDVSNPQDPKLVHKHVIGTRGSSSEALTNHLAFNYYAPKNILALPMTVCEGGDTNGGYGSSMTFSGLMVFDTTTANGFSLRGKVAHPASANANCYNWWTNASSEVQRSIVMDNFVYSVSKTRIKANDLSSLGTNVSEVTIGEAAANPY